MCQGAGLASVRLPYAFGTKTNLVLGLGLWFLVLVAVALVLGRR